MIFLLILTLLLIPYLVGSAIVVIFGERSHRGPIRWVVGAISLIVVFSGCLLWALKFDYSLGELTNVYGGFCISLSVGAIPIVGYAIRNHRLTYQHINLAAHIWIIPAIIIGAFTVFVLNRTYVNDITIETVRTTLSSGTIYEYSSLLGTKMEAGLPIFNKLETIPILYAVLLKIFPVDVFLLTSYIVPIMTYSANLFLMWEVSKFVAKENDRNVFMIFHLAILLAGTYLPETSFPVTVGQPLLMQGYTGYAWAYGVVIPAVMLMLFNKRHLLAGITGVAMLGLMRYDRLFFAGKEFLKSYHSVNAAGKLWVLYIFAFAWWFIRRDKKTALNPHCLISGSTLISATLTDAYGKIGKKKSFVVYSIVIIMACCSFVPFNGATTKLGNNEIDFGRITEGKSDVTLWAPDSVMTRVRRETDGIKVLYGRDFYEEMIDGVNYEPYTEDVKELYYAMSLMDRYMDEYVESLLKPILLKNPAIGRVDVLVIPLKNYSDVVNILLVRRGFTYTEEYGDYLVMRRYD